MAKGTRHIPVISDSDAIAELIRERDAAAAARSKVEQYKQENKILREQKKEAVTQLESYLAIREETPLFQIPKIKASKTDSVSIPIFLWSDWHCEEEVLPAQVRGKNEFNLDIANARIQRLGNKCVEYAKSRESETDIPEAIVWLGGDFITGYIHEESMPSNSMSPPEAILWVKTRIKALIEYVAREFPKVRVVCNVGNHGRCHDDQTELLTENGWCRYDEVSVGDRVLTRNMETGASEWQALSDVYVADYEGPMHYFHSRSVDFAVTPHHRMVVAPYHTDRAEFVHMEDLSEATIGNRYIPKTASGKKIDLEGISDDELRLVGWILTDGSIVAQTGGHDVIIWQSKPHGRTEIVRLLEMLGCKYSESERDRDIKEIRGVALKKRPLVQARYAIHRESGKRFSDLLGGSGSLLPDWVWDLSERQVKVLLEGLMAGDGSDGGDGKYIGELHGKEAFLSDVQSLLIANGLASRIRTDIRGAKVLSISSSQRAFLQNWEDNHRVEHYAGKIWCGTVPNGTLVTRRNGVPLISGNTTQKKWVSNAQRNSYEWLMYHVLASEFESSGVKNVEFFIPESYFCEFSVFDFQIRTHHGDAVMFGGGVGGPSISINKAIGNWNVAAAVDFDYFGHLHTFIDHHQWCMNGSLIGYSPYSLHIKAKYQDPIQVVDFIHHRVGRTDTIKVYLK